TVDGTKTVNVSGAVNKATKYNITDANNKTFAKLTVKQSGEIPAMYIQSDMIMPIGLGYEAAHKNGYSSAGTIKMINGASTVLYDGLEFTDLSITAGDTPSTDIIGKYSYDLTLKEETPLTSGGGKTYSLVSYDADEARLRNMTAIDLANAMGLKDAVSCQPVEVYNNGVYMGSYLLIERVETSALTLEFTTGNENSFTSLMGQDITCITEGVTADQLTELEAKWAEAESVIYDPAATYEELSSVIDVESFAKVYLLQELTKGINAGADNYYVYYENGKFTAAFTPEYDNTLGQMLPAELTNPVGWRAKTKVIEGEGLPNAQAALCDNPVFWNCVKAEWIEVFYDAASSMVPTEATYTVSTKKVTGQSGTYAEYYTLMNKSGNMDDAKWGICTNDALASEGTYDTGDTYDYAFISLNNYIYQRINWMDEELSKGYTLAEPTLTTKKPVYAVNEVVEFKAEITSSGNLKYEFYNSKGELVYEETTDKGYVIYKTSYADEVEETIKVVISS
ncbi:MAG: CotH kinase family protein, partial [Ruminococcus sp.]|nr:CotH kinase family protein [Ruminococcus sp.]